MTTSRKIPQGRGRKISPTVAKAGAHALASAMVKKVSSTKVSKMKSGRRGRKC